MLYVILNLFRKCNQVFQYTSRTIGKHAADFLETRTRHVSLQSIIKTYSIQAECITKSVFPSATQHLHRQYSPQ